jgi:voltage-gated potassium channel Kch
VRDFFLTLFFVALGLKIPYPTLRLVLIAVALAVFVVMSRVVTVVPLLMLLRLDARTSGVVAINLGQVSEFSLVIMAVGLTLGHVSQEAGSILLYTLLLTAVGSTYLIIFNHQLASALGWLLERVGLRRWAADHAQPAAAAAPAQHIVLLGVAREGIAFLEHLDREAPALKPRIAAVDFNPETLERLMARGFECHYGDISNAETLRHAGIEHAAVVISSISDWMLKGTSNARILRQVRSLAPSARIIVAADTVPGARQLYAEGADYVLMPPVLAAKQLYQLLHDGTPAALPEARRLQERELDGPAAVRDGSSPSHAIPSS